MTAPVPTEGEPRPAKVVMLVDNAVDGDSRVQKVATAAAAAGYDVTLLGIAPGHREQDWQLGGAEVRLIPVPVRLATKDYRFRTPWLRNPLSYGSEEKTKRRYYLMKAWRADIQTRRAEMALERGGGIPFQARRAALKAESVVATLSQRWVRVRRNQFLRARKAGIDLWGDNLTMRFWFGVRKDKAWRRLYPSLWNVELAFGPLLDQLKPDLIHAHDFQMLGVGSRATLRLRAAGHPVKLVWDAHEYVPGLKPRSPSPRWLPVHVAYEREFARYADAVITVSDGLAEALQKDHGLKRKPFVVLNAPHQADAEHHEGAPNLREMCGLDEETPLIVYSGAAAPQRGIQIMIEALPDLPGVHVALVVNKHVSRYVRSIPTRAAQLGVAERVHILPYVPHYQVVEYLSSADAGVIPIHHWPNHEIALITKFFEYSHARLPMIVSDVRTMAATVRATGQGEVFRAEDQEDYVRAVEAVLADPKKYAAAYDNPGLLDVWTWEAQAETLTGLYRDLLTGRL
jgi:glycosyltransferase involved in cell wall biosynthesis